MRIILSISSDIGTALAIDWLEAGHKVSGTYRTWSPSCDRLEKLGATLVHCDFANRDSILQASATLLTSEWEVLVLAAGDQNPIGMFAKLDFDDWERSLEVNFTGMLRFLQRSLKSKAHQNVRSVILFAGGGTNSATQRYSSYTISKIASIKMCELLDYEIDDTKFTILGPGWVHTKIHQATLENHAAAGNNFEKTKEMLENGQMNPMGNVIEFCNWVISQPKNIVGGRNFSVVHDDWRSEILKNDLDKDTNLFKLRRFGNDRTFVKEFNGRE